MNAGAWKAFLSGHPEEDLLCLPVQAAAIRFFPDKGNALQGETADFLITLPERYA